MFQGTFFKFALNHCLNSLLNMVFNSIMWKEHRSTGIQPGAINDNKIVRCPFHFLHSGFFSNCYLIFAKSTKVYVSFWAWFTSLSITIFSSAHFVGRNRLSYSWVVFSRVCMCVCMFIYLLLMLSTFKTLLFWNISNIYILEVKEEIFHSF